MSQGAGFPGSLAYVSNLACVLRHDSDIGAGLPEFTAHIRNKLGKIERNCSIKEVASKKQLYSNVIGKTDLLHMVLLSLI